MTPRTAARTLAAIAGDTVIRPMLTWAADALDRADTALASSINRPEDET